VITLLERWAGVVLMSALDGYYEFVQATAVDATTGIVAIAIGHFATGAQFTVRETFVGTLPVRTELVHCAGEQQSPIEFGEQRPYLVVIHTDGQTHVLAGYARVYEVTPHGYAVPVTQDDRRVPQLCEPLPVKRLGFRHSRWEEGIDVDDAIELYRKLYFAAHTQPAPAT
jgi:hypothetical protein